MGEPTLPELLRSSRVGRVAGIVLILAAVALVALFVLGRGGSFSYDGPEAPPFSISWGSDLEETPASAGSLLELEEEDVELGISSLVSAGEEEPLPGLAIDADRVAEEIRRTYPGARIVLEGRTKLAVDRGPEAYQLAFAVPQGSDPSLIGKWFLVPDPDRPGEGVRIEIVERAPDARALEKVEEASAGFFLNWPIQLLLEDAASVRTNEAFEKPLRSFEFG